MKKFIVIILFLFISFHLMASDLNSREITKIETLSSTVTVSVSSNGVTRINSSSGSFHLDNKQLSTLLTITSAHLELVDMVGTNNLSVVYRRNTGRMVAMGNKNLNFIFYSPGTGAADCIFSIRIVDYNSYKEGKISFTQEQIRQLEQALNTSVESIQNLRSQITMLNEKVQEIRSIY